MKLRIKDNSIRFRLTKSEVAELAQNGKFESSTQFVNQKLTYVVESTTDKIITSSYDQNRITVFIPKETLENWAASETVSLENTVEENANDLKILIEKDFACLTERAGEDETDNYPNPNLTC